MASAIILPFARKRVGSLVRMWNACIVLCMPLFLHLASPAADSRTEPMYSLF